MRREGETRSLICLAIQSVDVLKQNDFKVCRYCQNYGGTCIYLRF